jgi:hypothetical protein
VRKTDEGVWDAGSKDIDRLVRKDVVLSVFKERRLVPGVGFLF